MVILVVVMVVAAMILSVSWSAAELAIHPPKHDYQWSDQDHPSLSPEPVRFPGADGISLFGWFFRGRSPATVVLTHAYSKNQETMIPWVEFLVEAGFSTLTYDMRNRGRSGGDVVTLGEKEREDLVAVVDYLITRQDVDPDRIAALGVSLGAAVTIMAAADDSRIKAIVADCAFSKASIEISTSFQKFLHLPTFLFEPVTVKIAEWRTGCRVRDIKPVAVIGRISPRPILIIQGTKDKKVPPKEARMNFAAAREPKEIWWVPGADHAGAYGVEPEAYRRRATEFFSRTLDVSADPSTSEASTSNPN